MEGFTDSLTGEARRGFMDIVSELENRFPNPADIESEKEKKPSSNYLENIYVLKMFCKTTTNLPH